MRAHVTNIPGWHHYQRRSDGDRVIGQNTIHGRLPPFRSFRFPRNSRYDIGPLETGRVHTHTHIRVEYIRGRVASTSFQSICDDTPMGRHSYRSGTQTRDERHATVISSPSADLITLPSISEYLDVNFDHDLHCLLFDSLQETSLYCMFASDGQSVSFSTLIYLVFTWPWKAGERTWKRACRVLLASRVSRYTHTHAHVRLGLKKCNTGVRRKQGYAGCYNEKRPNTIMTPCRSTCHSRSSHNTLCTLKTCKLQPAPIRSTRGSQSNTSLSLKLTRCACPFDRAEKIRQRTLLEVFFFFFY